MAKQKVFILGVLMRKTKLMEKGNFKFLVKTDIMDNSRIIIRMASDKRKISVDVLAMLGIFI